MILAQQQPITPYGYIRRDLNSIPQTKFEESISRRLPENHKLVCRLLAAFIFAIIILGLCAAIIVHIVKLIQIGNQNKDTTTFATTASTITTITTAVTVSYTPSTATCSSSAAPSCIITVTPAAICQSYEVSWNGHCYYLDGSNGSCANGYSLATNGVLACITTNFTGKNYATTVSNNCCVLTADTYECFGLTSNCNAAGPFASGPTIGGSGCSNAQNHYSRQLTFCGSI